MSKNINSSRIQRESSEQKLSQGLTKHAASIPSLFIAGTSLPTSQILATLQSLAKASQTAETAAAAWHAALDAERAERAKARPLLLGLRQALQVMFAGSVDTLADFGLSPRKPRVITPQVKVAAAAKAKATRAQRHTMGTKQKKQVKGDVSGVVVTPVTSAPKAEAPAATVPTPASPAPAPTPAPAGTSPQAPVTNLPR